jgi:hypothetical protein
MSNWVDDFGFNAVDVMPTTEVKIDSSPIKDDVEGINDNVIRIEKSVMAFQTLLNSLNKKLDSLITTDEENEEIIKQRKYYQDVLADKKVKAMADILGPLLQSLYRTQNQAYIHWPNRGPVIQEQVDKMKAILDGSAFEGDEK